MVDVPRCDWHADAMPYAEDERQKIADAVRRKRIELKLDKEPASRAAGVNSITWKRVEDAEGVRDASLAKILASLELTADDIFGTGTPVPLPSEKPFDASSAARHNLEHVWGAGEKLVDEVLALDPPTEVKRLLRAVVAYALSSFMADEFIKFSITREERDELLAELYRRRDRVINQIGAIDDLEAASEQNASTAVDENKEDLDGSQVGTPMPVPRLGGEAAGLDRANEG